MDIVIKFTVEATPEKVFKAVTTKKGYQGWWAAVCDVNCRPNGSSSIRFEKSDIIEEMCFRTVEVRKNEKLVWHCYKNNVFESMIDTLLSFEIKELSNGSQIQFRLQSKDKNWEDHPEYEDIKQGWLFFMDSLKEYCEVGVGQPWG
jgi:uncharacterized protein YndB with AHSA1/START domain